MGRKTTNDRISLEKFLRYVLGVAPNEFGLVAGDGGYVATKDLLAAVRDEDGFRGTSEGRIMELVNVPGDKSPFETDGNLIRLKPGLSKLPPPVPEDFKLPKELFVALKPGAWPNARKNGLIPRRPKENRVPLFTDKDLALRVAKRQYPDAVSVRVLAAKASAAGTVFTPHAGNIVLCDFVPPEFLLGPPVKPLEEKETAGRAAAKPKSPFATSPEDFAPFALAVEPRVHKGKKKGKYEDEPDWKVTTKRDRRDKNDR
jgi:RNA:NAD 2'-phosphotransferase (TPT1/KptA family)